METQSQLFPRRLLSLFLSLVMLVTMLAVTLPVGASANDGDHEHIDLDATYGKQIETAIKGECDYRIAYQLLDKVNAQRKKAKLKALSMDKTLQEAAMLRAAECAVYYQHIRPSGENCFSVLEGNYTHFSSGENIAAGYKSTDQVMDGWMNSPGHKSNILNPGFQIIGIGVFQIDGVYYWSQLFNGQKKQSTPTQEKPVTKTLTIKARPKLLSLSINHKKLTLNSDSTATLEVSNNNKGFPYYSHHLDPSNLSFVSANTCVAKVSSTGTVTPIGKGSTTITVKASNGVNLFNVSVTADCKEVHTHKYSAATCTAAKTCKTCGATSGKKLGHTYSNACDKTCNRCKATRSVAAHTYKKVITKATLTKDGSVKNVCSKCGYTASKRTTIYKASKISLSKTAYTYNGKTQKPSVVVKDSKGNKISSSYYTVTYASGRKNVGTYKVTVKLKGNYSGTKTLTFTINPVKTTIKATAAKKSLKLTIGKKSAQVTGYEVQYSTTKSFKSYKSKLLTSYKKTSLTLTGLKAKTTYYVRVRTYKTIGGKKCYSGWSTVVYKKTK